MYQKGYLTLKVLVKIKLSYQKLQNSSLEENIFRDECGPCILQSNSTEQNLQLWFHWSRKLYVNLGKKVRHRAKCTWRTEKTFSATYFCWAVAPLCCNLSGWRHSRAFWYAFFTCELSMRLVSGTEHHPLLGHRTWTQVPKGHLDIHLHTSYHHHMIKLSFWDGFYYDIN